jgi:membrane protease YdiL (CAAX protease family)
VYQDLRRIEGGLIYKSLSVGVVGLRDGTIVPAVRLRDMLGITLGMFFLQFIVLSVCQGRHVSLFMTYIVVTAIGDLWWMVRYDQLAYRRGWQSVQFRFAPVSGKALLRGVGGAIALMLLTTAVSWTLIWAGVKVVPIPAPGFVPTRPSQLLLAIAVIGIVGPFAEELVFRGALLDWLRQRISTSSAIVLSSLLFAVIHGISFKSGVSGWLQFGYRFLMGVANGVLALRYHSLRVPFVLHAVNNVIVCVASVFPDVFQAL